MYTSRLLQQPDNSVVLDPTERASRLGYREITGEVPSTGERVRLLCWAIVFELETAASDRYREIVSRLADVDGNGLAVARLADFDADRFGNMSERDDSLGELATVWVTGTSDGGVKRGAILAAVGGALMQVLALSQYDAEGDDRAPHMIERLALSMVARQAELEKEPWADTMSYLPLLGDVGDLLENAAITFNRYGLPQSRH